MKTLKEYTAMVENAVSDLRLPTDRFPNLYEPVVYGMEEGGKRLRPILLLMAYEAVGGNPSDATAPAVGIEMFHNFTLLHDDVMDRSELRRGRPTVHKKWNENTAILSGDTMVSLATRLIAEVPDNALRKVLDEFNRTALAVYEGQADDMDFETREDVSLPEYLDMIEGKTSALLAGALKIGALAAGADDKTANALWKYGLNLGFAFQIQDDWLDVYGDPETFGKPIGGDILNRKKTFLLISAMNNPEVSPLIDKALDTEDPQERINAVREIYSRFGIPEICKETVNEYCSAALASLEGAEISADAAEAFRSMVNKIIGRQK